MSGGYSWNPVTGCSKVSPGCDHCWAEATAVGRLKGRAGYPGLPWTGPNGKSNVVLRLDRLGEPLHWKRPRRVVVCSMSDLFQRNVPDEFIARVFATMVEADWHTYQILTKRAARVPVWWSRRGRARFTKWPQHVWLGTSVESQQFVGRIEQIARVSAPVRFVSAEPLLGPLDLRNSLRGGFYDDGSGIVYKDPGLSWVIIGGETGPRSRPMYLSWMRDIVAQCSAAGVACFVKQLGTRPECGETDDAGQVIPCGCGFPRNSKGGDMTEWPEDLRVREWPT